MRYRSFDFSIKYGKLTPMSFGSPNYRGDTMINCTCECGGECCVKSHNLKIGKTKSCGCINTGTKVIDITGQKFGRLLVIDYVRQNKWRDSIWLCQCDCGNLKEISKTNLYARTKSCGCYNSECKRALIGPLSHGWNPKLTDDERSQKRNYDDYRLWSFAVRQNYSFKCAVCSSDKKLVSHHLNSYSSFPDQRTDILNGVCLCSKCHIMFHKQYGYKNNTREQYLDFADLNQLDSKIMPFKVCVLKVAEKTCVRNKPHKAYSFVGKNNMDLPIVVNSEDNYEIGDLVFVGLHGVVLKSGIKINSKQLYGKKSFCSILGRVPILNDECGYLFDAI